MDKLSFTAANSIPVKIFKHKQLLTHLNQKYIHPIHAQINPTNKCNLKCKFCSCSKRDKKLELDFSRAEELVVNLGLLGCKAITITGGGEPCLYSKINELIDVISRNGIKVGIVTNGYHISNISQISWTKVTWCRISASDDRSIPVRMLPSYFLDWAFSYVVTKDFKIKNLINHIKFANDNAFSHVRIVSDILDNSVDMFHVKQQVVKSGIKDNLCIYQGRKDYTEGANKCYISLLKPNIGADGNIYPCCGAQYAMKNPALDYSKEMSMGKIEDILHIYSGQKNFNGSKCVKCYYENYNLVLAGMLGKIKHEDFV